MPDSSTRPEVPAADPKAGERVGVRGAWCFDCGLDYRDDGFADLVVPHEVWNGKLSPSGDEGGLLCPTCMVRRAKRAGLDNVPASFGSGPFTLTPDAELRMAWERIDRAEREVEELRALGVRKPRGRIPTDRRVLDGEMATASVDRLLDIVRHALVRDADAASTELHRRLAAPPSLDAVTEPTDAEIDAAMPVSHSERRRIYGTEYPAYEFVRLGWRMAGGSREEPGRRDGERLDYLARELDVEQEFISATGSPPPVYSLFRRNVPITRESIDAAMAAMDRVRARDG